MRGIQIIGDIPIYVAHDSADVGESGNLCLDQETSGTDGGSTPDYFSATALGQPSL